MAKVICPNGTYSGLSATVVFEGGVGETEDAHLLGWFREKGYAVEDDGAEPDKFAGMDVDALRAYAEEKGIPLGNASSVNGVLKKIMEAEQGGTA